MKTQEKIKRTEKAISANIAIIVVCAVALICMNGIQYRHYGLLRNYIVIPNLCFVFIIGLNIISVIALYIQRKRFIKENKILSIEKEFQKDNNLI